jgi:glycosyltransferase involved in cell wall biosynthesis
LRILILVDCYYPSTKSSAKLVHDLATELHRRGDEAVILTPSEAVTQRAEIASESGITVVRVKNGRIKGANKLVRAAREARLSANLWRGAKEFLRQKPCDLILFYSPTIFFGTLVRKLKKLWGCPAYLILRDIFPEWAADTGVIKRGMIYRFFRRAAIRQYKIADVIAVQSPANLGYFARSFPRSKFSVRVLFNWTALEEAQVSRTNYRSALGLVGKTVFLYGGNIGVAQDMDNILRLATRLAPRTDIHLLLVGDGTEVARLKADIAERQLANVQIVSGLSQQEYLSMVSEFDFGLISLDARLTTHNVPGKLLSYLYWGLPVLASVNPGNDLLEIIEDNGAGFCVFNGDDEKLARAALRLADDRKLAAAMRANARRLLEKQFSVESAVSQLFTHLNALKILEVGGEKRLPFESSRTFSRPRFGTNTGHKHIGQQ